MLGQALLDEGGEYGSVAGEEALVALVAPMRPRAVVAGRQLGVARVVEVAKSRAGRAVELAPVVRAVLPQMVLKNALLLFTKKTHQ